MSDATKTAALANHLKKFSQKFCRKKVSYGTEGTCFIVKGNIPSVILWTRKHFNQAINVNEFIEI